MDTDGKPSACTISVSSGSAALDTVTCELAMRNARFMPALNVGGQPVVAPCALRDVVWRLNETRIEVAKGAIALPMPTFVMAIDVTGQVTACRIATPDSGRGECSAGMVGAKLGQVATRNGVPVPGV